MIKIFTNAVGGDARMYIADNQVACGSVVDLARNMSRENELAVIPHKFDLENMYQLLSTGMRFFPLTRFPRM